MTVAEERNLIQQAQQGDAHAVAILAAEHAGFIRSQANRYWGRMRPALNRKGIDREDLHQEATMGFLEAIQHFNPACPFRLCTYAGSWMYWRVISMVERGEFMVVLTGKMRDKLARERASRLVENDDLRDKLRYLPARLQTVLKLSYGIDGPVPLTDGQVAARLGLSRARVNQLLGAARERLEKAPRPEKV